MSAFDKPPPSIEDAQRLSKFFIVLPIPKPGIKIGNKVYNGKAACIKDWPKITKELMVTQMQTWFNGKNENNIAIILSNKGIVIDSDGQKCENIIWSKIVPNLSNDLQESFRKTARTRTGGGGEHIIFGIRQEDFPDGVPTRNIIKLGEHEEIKLIAMGGYVVERGIHETGKEYLPSNDIEKLVYLSKEQVEELLSALSNLKPETQKQKQTQKQNKQSKRKQQQEEQTKVYSLDDSKVESIAKELAPFYKTGSRDEIAFSLGGCLHKWRINKESAIKTINLLAIDASDEERSDRIRTIENTYTKKRDSSDVSGRKRFIENLALVTNIQTAIDIVTKITYIVTQARNEQGDDQDTEGYTTATSDVMEIGSVPEEIIRLLGSDIYKIVNFKPMVLIVAHNRTKQIVKALVKRSKYEINNEAFHINHLDWKNTIIDAIPIKIVKNDNPLDGTVTYKITFACVGSKKPFTIGPGTIRYITEELQDKALVLKKAEAPDALTAIVRKYESLDLTEINDRIPTPGYYWLEGRIVGYDITQNLDLDPEHNQVHKEQVLECIKTIDDLYVKNKNKAVYATVLKWSVLAPFSYVKKCIDPSDSNWLPYLQAYGWTRTGKNTMGKIALAVCRKFTKKDTQDHILGFGNVNTDARMGRALGLSTYPKLVNEVGALASEKYIHIVELIKHAVESLTVRGAFKGNTRYGNETALCPLILTSNPPPPTDPAYKIRVIPLRFDKIHETTEQEKEDFNKWAYEEGNIFKLGTLGDFAAKCIIADPNILKKGWEDAGKIIITEFYKSVGMSPSDWIDLVEKENAIEQSNDETYFALRGFLEQAVIEGYRKDFRINPDGIAVTFQMRLSHCLDYRTVPYLIKHPSKSKPDGTFNSNSNSKILITWNVIPELLRSKVPNITTLPSLAAEIPGFQYGNVKMSGLKKAKKVVHGSYEQFVKFIECTVEGDALEAEEEEPDEEESKKKT